MIPTAYRATAKHRVLWATMNFMVDRDPVGIRTKAWDRPVIKATVDRRKLILEHRAADEFAGVFRAQVAAVQNVLSNQERVTQAIARFREPLEQAYWKVMLDASASYGAWTARHLDVIAKAPDPFRDPMVTWLRQFAAARVADINATTRDQIQRILAAGTEAGDSVEETARNLDALMLDEIIPNRSLTIARTEVGNAANFASHEAATASGVPMRKTWLSMGDEFVRDDHADADGQTVDADEPFEVGGEQLQWPGDISLGASAGNVINCRCALTWDVAEET